MKPNYKVVVNENDDTGVNMNSFVSLPAHNKKMIWFTKQEVKPKIEYQFNEEKRTVIGVMIAANEPIDRYDKEIGEYTVEFFPETIDLILRKIAKNNFGNNINLQHNDVVDGVYRTEVYTVSNADPKRPNVPEFFKEQGIKDGSVIAVYHVENDEVWNKVKSGEFQGQSIELTSYLELINNKTNMSKLDKFMETLKEFFTDEQNQEENQITDEVAVEFSKAMTVDGVELMYSGDIKVNETVFTMDDGTGAQVPAPAGDHEITIEDGTVMIITLDETGLLVAVEMNVNSDATMEEVMEAIQTLGNMFKEQFQLSRAEYKEKIEKLETQLSAIKQSGKFKQEPKPADIKKENKGYKSLLN